MRLAYEVNQLFQHLFMHSCLTIHILAGLYKCKPVYPWSSQVSLFGWDFVRSSSSYRVYSPPPFSNLPHDFFSTIWCYSGQYLCFTLCSAIYVYTVFTACRSTSQCRRCEDRIWTDDQRFQIHLVSGIFDCLHFELCCCFDNSPSSSSKNI